MKRLALAVSMVAFSAAGASAADMAVKALPPPTITPIFDWTGFYAGLNGGYGWSNRTNDTVFVTSATVAPALQTVSPSGGFGGGQLGYNFQRGGFVSGVEADLQWAGIKDSSTTLYPTGIGNLVPFTYRASLDLEWFGTVRGRIGYAFDRTLVYVTGGLAYGQVAYSASYFFNTPNIALPNRRNVDAGWVIGGGVEHKFTPNWSVKGEYQYMDLGSRSVSGVFPLTPQFFASTNYAERFSTVRVGLNYRFGGGGAPVVANY